MQAGRKQLWYSIIECGDDTTFGPCGIVWSAKGVVRTQMPDLNAAVLREKLERFTTTESKEQPDFVRMAAAKLQAHLAGHPQNFSSLPLDFDGVPEFHQTVYRALQTVPAGQVTTYGALAAMAGSRQAARAVGVAMAKNPLPLIVPCHRVVTASGKLGGFSAFGGQATKMRLLDLEKQLAHGGRLERLTDYNGNSASAVQYAGR